MLYINSNEINIDIIDIYYMSLMAINPKVTIDYNQLTALIEEDKAREKGIFNLLQNHMFVSSGIQYNNLVPNQVITYLINYEGVEEEKFYQQGTNGTIISLNEEVRKSLISYNKCNAFMELYNEYKKVTTNISRVKSCFSYLGKTTLKTKYDTPLYMVPFRYSKSVTNRIYASDYNFQGLPKRYNSIITAPKGYFLLWADFSQIDLRVMCNMFYKDDKYLGEMIDKYPDYYEIIARTAASHCSKEFDPDEFKKERPIYKQKILATFYGESLYNTMKDLNQDLGKNLYNYITKNKNYIDYCQNISNNMKSDIGFYVQSYFGTRMLVKGNSQNTYRQCLNAPIQCTSAEIMKIHTYYLVNYLKKVAKEKLGDINESIITPMLNRHDECIFVINEKILPYMGVLKDFEKIQIDDWKPLEIHWSAGYSYGEDDEDLISQINTSTVRLNLVNNLANVEFKPYIPIPVTICVNMQIDMFASNTFIYFQNIDAKVCVQTNGTDDILKRLPVFIKEILPYFIPKNKNATRLVIYTDKTFYSNVYEIDGIEVVITNQQDKQDLMSKYYLQNIVYDFAKKLKMEYRLAEPENTLGIPKDVIILDR